MNLLRLVVTFSVLGALCLTGCRSKEKATMDNLTKASLPSPRPTTAPVKSKIDVCNLLTSEDLKALQGESYQDAQRSDRIDGDFVGAQCYYAMPTTVNSVVVNVTTARDEAGAPNPKAFWEKTFGVDEEKERAAKGEREREKEKPKEREREGEEKEGLPPERVKGLGDEAFWVGSAVGGALYVLKNDLFFRVSVGGGGDQKSKLNKSKTLADKILRKLS
jgi:hypothetical protein